MRQVAHHHRLVDQQRQRQVHDGEYRARGRAQRPAGEQRHQQRHREVQGHELRRADERVHDAVGEAGERGVSRPEAGAAFGDLLAEQAERGALEVEEPAQGGRQHRWTSRGFERVATLR
ncbi:MAG: hypothetical protein ACK56I_05470 [bacterium]